MDVVVNGNSEGGFDLLLQHLGTGLFAVEGGVDLGHTAPLAGHCGITGNGHHADLLIHRVIANHDQGIGVAAVHVLAQQKEVIDPFFSDQRVRVLRLLGTFIHHRWRGDITLSPFDRRGLDKKVPCGIHTHDDGGNDHQDCVQRPANAAALAFFGCGTSGLRLLPSAAGGSGTAPAAAGWCLLHGGYPPSYVNLVLVYSVFLGSASPKW